jgi:leader peptidase (prepilin peptidase)/N-methyltransferase
MAGMSWRLGTSWLLPAHLLMVAITTVLVVTDFDHLRLPNRIVYPGTVAGFVLLAAGALLEGTSSALPRAILGGIVYFLGFLGVFLIARGQGFGFGDVKLAVMLGLFASYYSWPTLVIALFATAVLGGVPAIIMLALGKGGKTAIPYGPPMILGTWVAIVFPFYLS